jgi:DNA-binding NarL/FixJ family response regulator
VTYRLLLVDDHPVVLGGLVALLDGQPDMAVVAAAATGAEARELASRTEVDVAVVDLGLPDVSGVELVRELRATLPEAQVVVLTMSAEQADVGAALGAGACAYLLKDTPPTELVAALRVAAAGGLVVSPGARPDLIGGPRRALPRLSEREREILDLLARGLPTATIAARLGVSTKTVRNRLSDVFAKLGASSRTEAVVLAREAGLGGASVG